MLYCSVLCCTMLYYTIRWSDFTERSPSAAPAAAAAQRKPDSPPPRKPEKRAAEPPVKATKIKS